MMAVERSEKSSSLVLRMEESTDTYKNNILNFINPEVTDQNLYGYAGSLSSLRTGSLDRVIRKDQYTLYE